MGRRLGSLLLLSGMLAPGCSQGDPLDKAVSADSTASFALWSSRASEQMGPGPWADFNEALQQIKFKAMSTGAASGSEAVEDATLRVIDGRKVRRVILVGLSLERDRLEEERNELAQSLEHNRLLRSRPGDEAKQGTLDAIRDHQQERLDAALAELARLRVRMAAYGLPDG